MSEKFHAWEREVLAIVQNQLPDTLTPYDDIAKTVGVEADDVIQLLERLRKSGVIRRFGASIRHQRSGWKFNAMAAWLATLEEAEECGAIAARFPAISHVYYRPSPVAEWPYNFYTMIHGRDEKDIPELLEKLCSIWPLKKYVVLPTLRELKKISMTYF